MMKWLYIHVQAINRALKHMSGQALSSFLSALVMGIALSLPVTAFVLLNNISGLAHNATGSPEISIYLEQNMTQKQIDQITKQLQKDKLVRSFRFVSKQAALEQLARSGLQDVLEGLPNNPLPDAFIVLPKEENAEQYHTLQQQYEKLAGVVHVQLDSAWVERLGALLELGRYASMILAALLGFALVVITFSIIRMQIMTRSSEINVSRLLGATLPFIRRPFYWFGILQGLCGGLVTLLIVNLVVLGLSTPTEQLASTYGAIFVMNGPNSTQSILVLLAAICLGWLGSAFSVRRYLK